jgi:hypothetical protein
MANIANLYLVEFVQVDSFFTNKLKKIKNSQVNNR